MEEAGKRNMRRGFGPELKMLIYEPFETACEMYKTSKNGAPIGSGSGRVCFWNLRDIGIQNAGDRLCCHLPVQHLFPPLPLASMLSVRTGSYILP